MFELTLNKQDLITPLLMVSGAVDKKPSSAILGHILLKVEADKLWITATDLDIEMMACIPCEMQSQTILTTVSAKKMVDIIRALDDNSSVILNLIDNILWIKSGPSKFKLITLPGDLYPATVDTNNPDFLSINRLDLMNLLQSTCFAMSMQDVRVYLNGLLIDIDTQYITAVAADGHRMAICRCAYSNKNGSYRFLITRKGANELMRLLQNLSEETVQIAIGKRHLKVMIGNYVFSSKLIEEKFPSYHKAIPKNNNITVIVDRDALKRALSRIIILANEKLRAVVLLIQPNQLTLITHNQVQEEATESLIVETSGGELKIGLNATYLLDVLNHLNEGQLQISFLSADSSILVKPLSSELYEYIIMPMKL